jgi:hypothetical protein
MFVIHETLPNKKKFEKILQCPFMKFPSLWYGSNFFLKIRYYYAFILEHMEKKHIFWMKFYSKTVIF